MGFASYFFETITAARAGPLATYLFDAMEAMAPVVSFGAARGPIHRRGKHKRNARLQAGRKTLPRKS